MVLPLLLEFKYSERHDSFADAHPIATWKICFTLFCIALGFIIPLFIFTMMITSRKYSSFQKLIDDTGSLSFDLGKFILFRHLTNNAPKTLNIVDFDHCSTMIDV